MSLSSIETKSRLFDDRVSLMMVLFAAGVFGFLFSSMGHGQNFSHGPELTAVPGLTIDARRLPWANPLAEGKLRIGLLAPLYTLGDATELSRHVECRLRPIPVAGPDTPGDALARSELPSTLDVLIAANLDTLGSEVIEAGPGGIVVIRYSGQTVDGLEEMELETLPNEAITRGIGVALWSKRAETFPVIRVFARGEQRIVDIAYPTVPPETQCLAPAARTPEEIDWTFVETHWALVVRAVRWAAGRSPGARVASVVEIGPALPNTVDIPPFLPQKYVDSLGESLMPSALRPFLVEFAAPTDGAYRIRYRARYPYRDIPTWTWSLPSPVPKGATSTRIDIPIGNGQVFLDLWIENRRGIVDWYSEALTVASWPRIESFRCVPGAVLPNGSIEVAFTVPPHLSSPRPAMAYLRVEDALGRLVGERYLAVPASGGDLRTHLALTDLLTTYVRVELYVADAAASPLGIWELERAAFRSVRLPVRRELGVGFVLMGETIPLVESNAAAFLETLREGGMNTGHVSAPFERNQWGPVLAALPTIPHVSSYSRPTSSPGYEREPCLTDPVFWGEEELRLDQSLRTAWPHSPAIYSLGDGNHLAERGEEVCRSETCMAGFTAYLARGYSSIQELNEAWSMNFSSFEAATRYVVPDDGAIPPWLDFRRYMDRVFVNAHVNAATLLRGLDPRARVGFCAIHEAFPGSGYDWNLLASRLDYMMLPEEPWAVGHVRAAASSNGVSILALSQPADESRARWLPYYAALQGFRGVYVAETYGRRGIEARDPALSIFGSTTAWFDSMAGSVGELNSGVAELLRLASRVEAGVGVITSQASRYLDARIPRVELGHVESFAATIAMLEELGYQPDVIPEDGLARRDLAAYGLLVLPNARSLSDATIDILDGFVGGSGVVARLGDSGNYDGHGIERSGDPLLNRDGVYSLLLESVGAAGIAPIGSEWQVEVRGFVGARHAFRFGSAEIVAFLQDPNAKPKRARVRLKAGEDRFVHVVNTPDAALGEHKASVRIGSGEVALFAVLPYAISRITMDAPDSVTAGKRLRLRLSLRSTDKLPGRHLVHVTFGPRQGERIAHYDRTVDCPGGSGTTYIPLALNERPGIYDITARDVLTGASESVSIRVNPAPLKR